MHNNYREASIVSSRKMHADKLRGTAAKVQYPVLSTLASPSEEASRRRRRRSLAGFLSVLFWLPGIIYIGMGG
jgi:hypothetical protein